MDTRVAIKKAEELAYSKIAERCKYDLFFLCKYVLGYADMDEFVHGPVCAAWRRVIFWDKPDLIRDLEFPSDYGRTDEMGLPSEEEKTMFYDSLEPFIPGFERDEESDNELIHKDKLLDDLNQLLMLLPRGTFKTSVITVGGPCQYFLHYSEHRILLDSETSTNTSGFLGEIKGHFEGNDDYRAVFYSVWGIMPDANSKDKSTRWHNSAVDLACRKKARKEPSIDTGGVDTTKNSRHYDLIIFDDLHSEINTKTKEQIDKVKDHWKLAYSLLDPGRPAVVIGTRWTHTDLYQEIIDEHAGDFNIITRQARSDDGALFFPEKLTAVFLDKQRERQGGYIFSCQYMNNPVDSDTAKFRREWFIKKRWVEVDGIPINWYLTIDPGGDGKNSDYAAFVLSGMDYQNNLYVRYIVRGKMSNGQIVLMTFQLFRRFHPRMVVVEALAGAGSAIERTYKDKQKELGEWLPIRYIKQRVKDKNERIVALAPKYEFGHVFHIAECPQLSFLEDELATFPKAKYDDVSDALATVLEVATPPLRNVVQKESSMKRKALFKKLNAPRSPMVGY